MPALKIDMREYLRRSKLLRTEIIDAGMRGALSAANRTLTIMQDRTRNAPPANPAGVGTGGAVNTGSFLQQWKAEQTPTGARTFNTAPYGPIIEYGRRTKEQGSKQPPTEAIARWIQRRLGKSEQEARQLAFVFARAINRRGLIGREIATGDGVLDEIAQIAADEIEREVIAVLEGRAA